SLPVLYRQQLLTAADRAYERTRADTQSRFAAVSRECCTGRYRLGSDHLVASAKRQCVAGVRQSGGWRIAGRPGNVLADGIDTSDQGSRRKAANSRLAWRTVQRDPRDPREER